MTGQERDAVYRAILEEELLLAMGCTEPIAVAYAAAKAREVLGATPQRVEIAVSGNILKNVKSVVVPNTGGLKGVEAAAAAGIVAGRAEKVLEVISEVSPEQCAQIRAFLADASIRVGVADAAQIFYIEIALFCQAHVVKVRIVDFHTNIVRIERDGEILLREKSCALAAEAAARQGADRSRLNVKEIVAFASAADFAAVRPLLQRQIAYNMAIAEEGLRGSYGANIGKVILKVYGDDVKFRAKAKAAAGSDARMNGCELPVVIVSGSGNQGIAASVPVIEYARELGASEEKLYRALLLSNLLTIHLKTGIGRLSAYCGVVSAGCCSGAGIAYLHGGSFAEIAHTIVNSLAIVSGMICDGAKASCAAKIAIAVEAGILGYYMYVNGQQFRGGDGIVKDGVEATIESVGRLAQDGMQETDKEIIRIMLGES